MKTLAIIGVLALLLLVACQPVTVNPPGPTTPPEKRQITVSSTAELTQKSDQVEIYLGVETTAPSAKDSQTRNADIMTKVVDGIKAAGLSDDEISTAGFNVYEANEWDVSQQKMVSRGFTTTNTVQIKTNKISLAGEILDAAAKAGSNRVNNVQFSLTTATQDKLRTDALKKATSDAKGKAQAIADGLGQKLGTVASVNEAQVYFPPMYARGYESAVALAKDSAPSMPPISAGQVSVTATVNVVYNIE
jgi:uncharacterized protein YggE